MNQGISTQIRPKKEKPIAWLMWAITASFVLFQFFLQLTSGEIIDGLMKSFSLSAFGAGVLASTYYYIYVTLQTPAGMLIDRYGPRVLLSGGALVCSAGALMFGLSHNLWDAVLGRLMMGGGAAFAFVGSLNVIARWFPEERFAFMAAIAETIGMFGSVVGGLFLANLVQIMGWRNSMIGASGLMVLIGALIWTIVRNSPDDMPAPGIPKHAEGELWRDLKKLIKNRAVWVNGIYSGLMFSIVTVFVALWAIPYFQLTHHLSLMTATFACNLVFIGVAFCGPFLGWLDSHIHHRRLLLCTCSSGSAVLLTLLIFAAAMPLGLVMTLMILLGFFLSGYVITFPIANEVVPAHLRGTSFGFVNMLSVGTAPIFQPIVGLILHLNANQNAVGVEHYTVHDYQIALSILPILLIVAAILTKWIPERPIN